MCQNLLSFHILAINLTKRFHRFLIEGVLFFFSTLSYFFFSPLPSLSSWKVDSCDATTKLLQSPSSRKWQICTVWAVGTCLVSLMRYLIPPHTLMSHLRWVPLAEQLQWLIDTLHGTYRGVKLSICTWRRDQKKSSRKYEKSRNGTWTPPAE